MRILNLVLLLLLIFATSTFSQESMEDVIYFKNKNIVKGKIIEIIAGDVVKIKLANGIVYTYPMSEVLRIEKAPTQKKITSYDEPKNLSYKSPGLAFVLSFVFVGAGQYYNGDVGKGVAQELMVIGGMVLVISENNKNTYYRVGHKSTRNLGLALALAGSLWSIIDAPISANKKNKKWMRKNEFGHFSEFESGNQIVGFDLGYRDKILGAKITLHF